MFDTLPLLICLFVATEPKPLPETLEGRVLDVFPGDRVLLSFGSAHGARTGMTILLLKEPQKSLVNLYELVEVSASHSIARRLDSLTPLGLAKPGDSAVWYPGFLAKRHGPPRLPSPPAEIPEARTWLFTGAIIDEKPVKRLGSDDSLFRTALERAWNRGLFASSLNGRLAGSLPRGWSLDHVSVTLENVTVVATASEGMDTLEWMACYSRLDKSLDIIVVSKAKGGIFNRVTNISRSGNLDDSDVVLSMSIVPNGRQWSRFGPVAYNRERYFEAKATELHERLLKVLAP